MNKKFGYPLVALSILGLGMGPALAATAGIYSTASSTSQHTAQNAASHNVNAYCQSIGKRGSGLHVIWNSYVNGIWTVSVGGTCS